MTDSPPGMRKRKLSPLGEELVSAVEWTLNVGLRQKNLIRIFVQSATRVTIPKGIRGLTVPTGLYNRVILTPKWEVTIIAPPAVLASYLASLRKVSSLCIETAHSLS